MLTRPRGKDIGVLSTYILRKSIRLPTYSLQYRHVIFSSVHRRLLCKTMGSKLGRDAMATNGDLRDPQTISYDGKDYHIIREGLADILIPRVNVHTANVDGPSKPKPGRKDADLKQTVFYNPIQQYNRDLSVLAIRAFAEDYAFCQASQRRQQRGKKRKRHAGSEEHTKEKKLQAQVDHETAEPENARSLQDTLEGGPDVAEVGAPDVEGKPKEGNQEGKPDGDHGVQEQGHILDSTYDDSHDALVGIETLENELGDPVNDSRIHAPSKYMNKDIRSPFRVLDALSATGLRALRYAKEIPAVTSVTANDLSVSATDAIKVNVGYNDLSGKIKTITTDAIKHMHHVSSFESSKASNYHAIDLDPYGTAVPFLDAAVQAVVDGGLLCVTCTDAGVFASTGYLEKTFSHYGGLPLKGPHAHEAGLRLIIHTIATSAARYGMTIEPLLSLSIDFYVRVWIRITKSPADVKFLASKTMMVYNCDSGCGAWETQYFAQARAKEARNGDTFYKFTCALGPSAGKECEHCGFKTHLAGPMWGGPLHNPYFVQKILDMLPKLDQTVYKTIPRIEGMLSTVIDESLLDPSTQSSHQALDSRNSQTAVASKDTPEDQSSHASDVNVKKSTDRPVPPLPPQQRSHHPFFVHPPYLARVLNVPTPSDAQLRGALRHLGYHTTRSHTKPGSVVTDAPWTVIWEIMREWARSQNKGVVPKMKENTAGAGIMRNERSRSDVLAAKQELQSKLVLAETREDIEGLEAPLEKLKSILCDSSLRNPPTADGVQPMLPEHNKPLYALDIKFDQKLGKEAVSGVARKKLVRYQNNPTPNWGPLGRAKAM